MQGGAAAVYNTAPMEPLLTVLHIVAAVLLVGIVLIQKDRGGGLAGWLGGSGGSPFGIKTADVLIKVTAVLFSLFLISALLLSRIGGKGSGEGGAPAEQGG